MGTILNYNATEIMKLYKLDKIKTYLKANNTKIKNLDDKAEEFYKQNMNSKLLKKVCGEVLVVEYNTSLNQIQQALHNYKSSYNFVKESVPEKIVEMDIPFQVIKVMPINGVKTTSILQNVTYSSRYNSLQVGYILGFRKVFFGNDTFMYMASWTSGAGKGEYTRVLFAAEKENWKIFMKVWNLGKTYQAKPQKGIFRITYNDGIIYYQDKTKEIQKVAIQHEMHKELFRDIDFYFNNVDIFTRFKMPGVRKTLLVGPPGTGKSSTCYMLAQMYKDKNISFCTDLNAAKKHMMLCSKHDVSTIIICEDVENYFSFTDASVLNFLDGIDLPKTKKGTYMIFTTNYPDNIEDRIVKRPGRIDKIIEVGTLKGSIALNCAHIYCNRIIYNKKKVIKDKELTNQLFEIVDNMTGAEIKELAQSTIAYSVSNNIAPSIEIMQLVKERMEDSTNKLVEYAKKNKKSKLGFGNNECNILTRRQHVDDMNWEKSDKIEFDGPVEELN